MPTDITLIGGGARSSYWRQMICDVLNREMSFRKGGEVGPALGAARLAQLAIETGKSLSDICPVPALEQLHKPNSNNHQIYSKRLSKFRALFKAVSSHY